MDETLGSVWTHWHAHPEAIIGLSVLQCAYLLGTGPLRKRLHLAGTSDPRQVATFTAGILVILLALLSPIHRISDNYLFSAHMLQHLLLTLVAPPLLILGTPGWLIRPLLRPGKSFRIARIVTHPVVAFVTFNVIFSIWHIPTLYNLSVTHHWVHIGEHLMFIATAVLMWWPITSNVPELPRLSDAQQMVYLFLISVAQIIVFAPITFSSEPLYQWYVEAPMIWNISPLLDQQLGGIIMKMGGAVIFMTLIVIAFFRWFKREEEDRRRGLASRVGYLDAPQSKISDLEDSL